MNTLVWRTRRTLAGEELGSSWVDTSEDIPSMRAKRFFPRVHDVGAWESTPGVELMPRCESCGSLTVWRGTWQCVGCAARGARQVSAIGGLPSALPREALAGVPIFSSSEGNNSTGRSEWTAAVEALTSFHRQKVAGRIRNRGTRPAQTFIEEETGECVTFPPYISQWHEQRVKGQAERFQRVTECGRFDFAVDIEGKHGKTSRPIRKRCDCWRVCLNCLNRRKWKLSQGTTEMVGKIESRLHRETGAHYAGPEGRWSPKMLTFTVQHGENPQSDARVIVDAWQRLLRRVRGHLAQRGATRRAPSGRQVAVSVPWFRALEVKANESGDHAHLHVWWYGPFLDVVLLRQWWGELVLESGRSVPTKLWRDVMGGEHGRDARLHGWLGAPTPDTEILWPVVDIRADRGGLDKYAQKVGLALYAVKGTSTERIEPAHAASIYEVFEGTRAVQWARGWAPPKKPKPEGIVTFRRLTEQEKQLLNRSALTRGKHGKTHEKDVESVASAAVGIPDPDEVASAASVRVSRAAMLQLALAIIPQ